MKDLTGTRVGSYEIVERLGGGGMAVVYRAVQQPLGREVALKALSPELFQDDGFVKRFEAEAKTLAKLDHPNILPIYDFELAEGMAYLTMPLIRGGTLRDILNRGPLDTLSAWRYLREIGDGLQHAHDAGIVHRDLKPTNVLIHSDGRAMLADFGLARGAGQPTHLTTVGLAIGTPGYMAPEQVMGHDVDRRAAARPEHRLIERLVGDPDAADDGREAGAGAGPVHPQLACGQPHPRCPRRHRCAVARDRVHRRPRAVRRPGSAQRRAARDAGRVPRPPQRSFRNHLRSRSRRPAAGLGPARHRALVGRGQARDGGAAMAGAWAAAQAGGNRQELQRGDGQRPRRAH